MEAIIGRWSVARSDQVYMQVLITDAVELEGVIEFKSLPSGLHNVKEDLVYEPSYIPANVER